MESNTYKFTIEHIRELHKANNPLAFSQLLVLIEHLVKDFEELEGIIDGMIDNDDAERGYLK